MLEELCVVCREVKKNTAVVHSCLLSIFSKSKVKVKVSFIVNFFTYTRHTKRSKLRFSLSHGEDKTYFTIFGPQTNISNVSNIKINKQ